MDKVIFLSGFYCAGKTSVGVFLAKRLKVPFCDTDKLLQDKTGKSARDLWQECGPLTFRQIEKELFFSLEKKFSIVACGGGTFEEYENVKQAKQKGIIIYLKAHFETLFERIKKRGFPVFFKTKEEARSLATHRFLCYDKIADFVIETDHKEMEEICIRIQEHINGQ